MKTKEVAEYGDFQTPTELAAEVCRLLARHGLRPASLLEPTCGRGSFLCAGLDQFKSIKKALGADINAGYVQQLRGTLQERSDKSKVQLVEADFFTTDWTAVLADLPEPVLVVGNLPWVTNAHLGTLGSHNLPEKVNFQNHNGMDAITGKANFDISEWMLIRLLEAMNGRTGTLAMLCKSSVARKTLYHAWKNGIGVEGAVIYGIDAQLHFDASVDAVLLVAHFRPGVHDMEAKVHPGFKTADTATVIGYEDGMLLADTTAYYRWKHLCGEEVLKWRSGVKHDCSKVMELRQVGTKYSNGLAELFDLEDDYIYPMLKSSDVASGICNEAARQMIVTQRSVGEDTAVIEHRAPKTWAYLTKHADLLTRRGSSIYRNRPPFSVFGVGEYSFAPWKVAISGFYKKLAFTVVGPIRGKPVMLDDTCYFLPCETQKEAQYLTSLLNSATSKSFYGAFVFWDAKRPITADLLRRLDLRQLAIEMGSETELAGFLQKRKGMFHSSLLFPCEGQAEPVTQSHD